MKNIDICDGDYAAKWGISDFYEDSEELLRNALASGEDFTTEWGCKKEIRYGLLTKEGDKITLRVSCHMDDLYESDDLIYDALWARMKKEEELPDEIIDSIREVASEEWLRDYSEACAEIPASSTFEEICQKLDELTAEAEKENDETFNHLCDMVEDMYKWWKETPNWREVLRGEA